MKDRVCFQTANGQKQAAAETSLLSDSATSETRSTSVDCATYTTEQVNSIKAEHSAYVQRLKTEVSMHSASFRSDMNRFLFE